MTLTRHEEALRLATACFPGLKSGDARQRISAADCYCDPPALALREVGERVPGWFTFTGGSGGAAKAVLAAGRRAALRLRGGG